LVQKPSLLQRVKTKLSAISNTTSSTQPPVVQTLNWPYQFFADTRDGNYFRMYDAMIDIDADLFGYLSRLAHMCRKAYGGIYIDAGRKLEPDEEDLLEEARKIAERLDFPGEFFSTSFDLLKYGDVVKHLIWSVEGGVTKIETLPRFQLTAVENKGQVGNNTEEIFNANFYVSNENDQSEMQVYDAVACVKCSLNCKSTYMVDLMGRKTYGVWSKPPTRTLLYYIEWKVNTMINDILWSHRNVPREWHKLDLSQFSPDKYTGTREERERLALAAARNAADAYSQSLQGRQVDVGMVTDKATEIEYVEPKSTNYQQPNEKLSQINEALSNAMGIPAITQRASYASALMSGSFTVLQALSIADIIRVQFEQVLRKSVQVKFGKRFDKQLDKLRIRLRLILEKDKTEIMRQVAIMTQTRCFTPTEIRAEWGLPPLTDDQKAEIYEAAPVSNTAPGTNSIEDTNVATEKTRFTTWPTYPSERNKTPQKNG